MTQSGCLYVVATPIGNLSDISARALEVLRNVKLIAAEDTRHTRKLLNRYGIETPMISCHEHNQKAASESLLRRLNTGDSIALVTDAGTPLVSDPGLLVVQRAQAANVKVIPVPGASALTAALSVCGIQSEKFRFERFLPAKRTERLKRLEALNSEPCTLVFFEAPHRIIETLEDMASVFGANSACCIAREMTKINEMISVGRLGELLQKYHDEPEHTKGEFTIIVKIAAMHTGELERAAHNALRILLQDHSPSKAAELTAKIFGLRKNPLYRQALKLSNDANQ